MKLRSHLSRLALATVVAGGAVAFIILLEKPGSAQSTNSPPAGPAGSNGAPAERSVELTSSQLNAIKIDTVATYQFPVEKEAVGSIDYDEDLSVQVFPPYQGKLLKTFVHLGDEIKKGQELYTVDSPDLVQAESTLIGAAATLDLTTKELDRAKELYATNVGVSQRELEQAVNDQQAAEGSFKAARDAIRIFGKSDDEVSTIMKTRRVDSSLIVRSPIAGQVTSMTAPPGMLVQPGNPPAPYSVADLALKWILANVPESEAPLYREGQPVKYYVMAFPGRTFTGKIAKVYPNVDPNTHRMAIRCEVSDPQHELSPGMLANFVIRVKDPVESTALPVNGVVRNGDGTHSAWVTTDRHHFTERLVTIGLQRDGLYQILDGLHPGDVAVTDGAIFLNNILEAPPSD
jgi:membrane fusion protein, heavy metal efflux system